uniref:Glucosidase II subunit alpha n=1 Tax=Globisporangium ultimum (strain ATCC 200006 / CBS 805.95 / DAOM BR144) TaxID=431595 RepID=K3WDY2_GLOUD
MRRGALALTALLAVALLLLPAHVAAVDHSKFRTCAQTQFCDKYRNAPSTGGFDVVAASVALESDGVRFDLEEKAQTASSAVLLQGRIRFVLDEKVSSLPAVRVHVKEKFADPNDPKTRWENPDVLMKEALVTRSVKQVTLAESGLSLGNSDAVQLFKPVSEKDVDVVVALRLAPFGVDVYLNKEKVVSTNDDKQFHYEIRRDRQATEENGDNKDNVAGNAVDVHEGKTIVDYGEDGLAIYADGSVQKRAADVVSSTPAPPASTEGWEEHFGGHTDKKKFGPSSIGLDIAFPASDAAHKRGLYGLPEHASDFLLKDTLSDEIEDATTNKKKVLLDPYRLYNLDVFEYELDKTMALYGAIPVLVAPNAKNTVGVFWHNPSETFVDIATHEHTKKSHWMSESGVLDLFVLLGPTSADFFSQYTLLTGRAPLPPVFAIGYHQCRWNYKNEADVDRVNAGFDEHLIPYDVLWLDIDHTDKKKYFTWDEYAFPTPIAMQERVARVGRKMVTIVDPHIRAKNDEPPYYVHVEAQEKGLYIKDADGKDFRGWCWPGDSSYVDFTNPTARSWWSSLFRYDKYQGSTKDLYTWNDMNEPSVFNGPEVSMGKNCLNLEGVEHREWHNMYGTYMQRATMEGQLVRQLPQAAGGELTVAADMHRPFVLSRAFWAGSQRYGAIWTGDNTAEWGHLQYATKMLLSMSVAGLTFVGADIGGFFGNPEPELLTRWYQAAVFQPFFRGHAHHDSKRREPWVFGEPHTSRIRDAIRLRYALLPYMYTLFHECAASGLPIMRPLWMHFAQNERSFTEEDQFLLGHDLLIKPIVNGGVEATSVFLPAQDGGTVWYHMFDNYKRFEGGRVHDNVPAPIESTPVFQRGGSVIARKNRVRRSSALMQNDPYTLVVTLDSNLEASGKLYLDDEQTYAAELNGVYSHVEFKATRAGISCTPLVKQFASLAWVEKIEIYGVQGASNAPQHALVNGERVADLHYDAATDSVVIRKPSVLVTDAWEIRFTQ